MNTQISFTADKGLKQKAMLKAKEEGIPLKTLLVYAMKGFVDGKISFEIEVAPKLTELPRRNVSRRLMLQAIRARHSKASDLFDL